MRVTELLTEALSSIVYHYTRLSSALHILQNGKFELSSVLGSVEQQYAPKDHFYFLSTTRTKLGGYHQSVSSDAVIFVLDGNWYNQRYRAKSIDYWGNRNPSIIAHRTHEAEDRLFSKESSIPIDGVIAIHVYVRPPESDKDRDSEWNSRTIANARQVLILAKKRNIKTFFYTDESAWRLQDTRKQANISILSKGINRTKDYISRHKGYLYPWVEILMAKDPKTLSDKGQKLVYSLKFYSGLYLDDTIRGLGADLSNARKPDSGPDRKHAGTIINFMRKNGLSTTKELVQYLRNKWKT
jgi:hypothetical protein